MGRVPQKRLGNYIRVEIVASEIENLDVIDDTEPSNNPTPTTIRKRKLKKKYKVVDTATENVASDIENLDDEIEPSNNSTPTTTHKRKFIVDDVETNIN
ncbi:hypothetical protein L6452_27670 [Arctium lappa]|uniref:Uncharacterized protein n=1 Tax=Arctium lappa TaxID=4217 RepID=A0ACB8ZXL4_ARCLA|nr:hypothetical protein L6452_27670 [Arctium lappa]